MPIFKLSIFPAAALSGILLAGGKAWSLWVGGFIYLVWACFGYIVEYLSKIEWRNPIRWPIFSPYVVLYLATCMFYWFPFALIYKPLWYVYAALFVASTMFNVTSHKVPKGSVKSV
jgi:hypothetical protein